MPLMCGPGFSKTTTEEPDGNTLCNYEIAYTYMYTSLRYNPRSICATNFSLFLDHSDLLQASFGNM